MYQRIFGSCNFDAAPTSAGVMQTLRPCGGCFYDFYLTPQGELLVIELGKNGDERNCRPLNPEPVPACPWPS